ncbi:MAG: hypothetical protein PVI06_20005 [Desulfobacterales bacterium]|jgi:hypothetical protein
MTQRESKDKNYLSGIGAYFFALIVGSGSSFAIATYWLGFSHVWTALLVGAVFSIIGALLGENVGDAIMFSLVVGLIVIIFITVGPEMSILRAVIIPVATGLCAGKLVFGIVKEVSS